MRTNKTAVNATILELKFYFLSTVWIASFSAIREIGFMKTNSTPHLKHSSLKPGRASPVQIKIGVWARLLSFSHCLNFMVNSRPRIPGIFWSIRIRSTDSPFIISSNAFNGLLFVLTLSPWVDSNYLWTSKTKRSSSIIRAVCELGMVAIKLWASAWRSRGFVRKSFAPACLLRLRLIAVEFPVSTMQGFSGRQFSYSNCLMHLMAEMPSILGISMSDRIADTESDLSL